VCVRVRMNTNYERVIIMTFYYLKEFLSIKYKNLDHMGNRDLPNYIVSK